MRVHTKGLADLIYADIQRHVAEAIRKERQDYVVGLAEKDRIIDGLRAERTQRNNLVKDQTISDLRVTLKNHKADKDRLENWLQSLRQDRKTLIEERDALRAELRSRPVTTTIKADCGDYAKGVADGSRIVLEAYKLLLDQSEEDAPSGDPKEWSIDNLVLEIVERGNERIASIARELSHALAEPVELDLVRSSLVRLIEKEEVQRSGAWYIAAKNITKRKSK